MGSLTHEHADRIEMLAAIANDAAAELAAARVRQSSARSTVQMDAYTRQADEASRASRAAWAAFIEAIRGTVA